MSQNFMCQLLKKLTSGTPKKFHVSRMFKYLLFIFVFAFWGIPRFGFNSTSNPPSQSVNAGSVNRKFYSEEELNYITHQITKMLIDSGFNGNVLIARLDTVIYERSFGFSSFSKSEPMNIETTFQLASISKTFTASAVLMLQRDSLIRIDDPVKKYIPEFPFSNITVRHLLTHTSGLQNYMWLVERNWKKKERPTNEDILKLFISHSKNLNFRPGTRFEYSNSGYVFLGLLIERVSGQSFAQYIHENIFDPLGMERSFVYDLHNPRSINNRAFGYRKAKGRNVVIPDDALDGPLGDKGIFSSVHDLYKWDQALYGNDLLPPDMRQEAFQKARLNNDTLVNYGLGWRLQTYIGKNIVHHPGRWHGFRTSFKRFPDDRTTIIVLSNNNRGILEIINGIQDILYFDEKEKWIASSKNINQELEEQLQESLD
jgi:CubicO group peptidase (beta-lactamase class C family)